MTKAPGTPTSTTQQPRAPWVGPLFFGAIALWATIFAFIFT